MNKVFHKTGLVLLVFFFSQMCFSAVEPSVVRPNFLIIMADDMGYGDLGIHGGTAPTPHLDKLFESGMVMENFMVTPLCSPTRAGLLTGCNPLRLNQGPYVDGVLDPSITTFGSAFQQEGYVTGIFGKWHNSIAPVFDKSMPDVNDYGFDEWLGGYGGGFDLFTKVWPGNIDTPCWSHNRTHVTNDMEYATDDLTDYALRFMQKNKDRNFVCYLPELAMHEPYHAKMEDIKRVPQVLIDAAGGLRTWEEYYKLHNDACFGGRLGKGYVNVTGDHSMESIKGKLSEADLKVLYAAMLISLDDNVGRLLDWLKESGLEDNTVVWFFSDNGGVPPLGSSGPLRGQKFTIWDGGIHSRAVVRWPAAGWGTLKTYDGLMRVWDVYPTCMAMAGLTAPNLKEIDGKPCCEAMKTNQSNPVNAYRYLWEGTDVIRTEQWKLVRSWDHSELYDLKADLAETTDVSEQHPEAVRNLTDELNDWVETNQFKGGNIPHRALGQTAEQAHPAPLEVEFNQIGSSPHPLLIRLLTYPRVRIQTGDQLEYDIRFEEQSKTDGGHLTLHRNTGRPLFFNQSVDQFGRVFSTDYSYADARGRWAHRVVGIGQGCPEVSSRLDFLITSGFPGTYRFALDNIVIRRRDGSTKILWKSGMPLSGAAAPKGISGLRVSSSGSPEIHPASLSDAEAKVTRAAFTPLRVNSAEWKGEFDDLFRTAVVDASTPVLPTTDIEDLFTGLAPTKKGFVVFTDDGARPGGVIFLDFHLPAPINLNRINVILSADSVVGSDARSVSRIKFYAAKTADVLAGNLVSDIAINPDYADAYGSAGLSVSMDVPSLGVQYFRIEFFSGDSPLGNGPRVVEVDGF